MNTLGEKFLEIQKLQEEIKSHAITMVFGLSQHFPANILDEMVKEGSALREKFKVKVCEFIEEAENHPELKNKPELLPLIEKMKAIINDEKNK